MLRGDDNRTGELFSYVDLEARVRCDHPLRAIRTIVNEALGALEREFAALYSTIGRPSIPPEKLLRAMLLQAFYSIRSERLLMERLEYDLLFRWFVGIGVDNRAWDHSTFSKNRDRLLEGDIAAKVLAAVLAQPRVKRLLSSDHFSVDGTLIEAWASMTSVKPKNGSDNPPAEGGGRNQEADFHGRRDFSPNCGLVARFVSIQKDTLGRAVKVLVLAAAQRPQEGDQADTSEEKRYRDEVGENAHALSGSVAGLVVFGATLFSAMPMRIRRNALLMTRMDDPDMAIAATSGVT